MLRRVFITTLVILAFLLSSAVNVAAIPPLDHSPQDDYPQVGMASTANAVVSPESASFVQANVEPVRYTTAKSLRHQDFAPILETSLLTTNDYSVYAWIHFRTGASSATIRLRWRWYQPDNTYFDAISPWWSFGSEGKATAWLELQTQSRQTGRWQVKYYVQTTEGGSWQFLGENIFFINPGLPCTQLITNGGFEAGSSGWQKSRNTYIGPDKPHWGNQSAWLGGANNGYYYLYQDVTLPAAASGEISLAFYYNLFTEEGTSDAHDFFKLQIRDTSNNLLETLDTTSNLTYYSRNPRDVWQPLTWDLSAYAGRTIRIWIEVRTDYSLPTTWYLDDFSVSKCSTSVSIGVKVILAEPSDENHDSKHNRAYYENLFRSLRSYYIENTMGYIILNLTKIYDNGGSWYKLSKTHKEYAANPLDFVREAEQAALGTTMIPKDTIVIVVHAGPAAQTRQTNRENYISTQTWESPDSPNGNEIVVSEDDPLGGWAHEIGHDLGTLLVNSATPDLYKMGNVGNWDLMASGSWNGGWFCNRIGLCDGSNPPHMSSYTKEFLRLLRYQRVDRGISDSYWVDVLPRKQLKDNVLQYVLTTSGDGIPKTFYVIETRNQSGKYSQWDTSTPDTGLVLYWVDTKGKPKYGNYANNIAQTINQVAVLKSTGLFQRSEYFDADNLIRFKVVEERAQGTNYALRLEISTPTPDFIGPTRLAGIILRPDGKVAADVAPWRPIAAPPLYLEYEPDLDLHVYTDDGRHVGMNYVTGQYEIQVEGALASGNLHNAHEWILLPEGISFHYIVRSTSTYKFLRDNPKMAAYTDSLDGYEVYGLLSDPATGFFTSTTRRTAIESGSALEHAVSIGQTSIQVGPGITKVLPIDMALTVYAPELVFSGELITYTLIFGNSGGTTATGVNLRVRKPDNTDLISAPGFSPIGNNEYSYQVSSMGIADGINVVFVVRAHSGLSVGTPLTLTATIGDDGTHGLDGVPANNQVVVVSRTSTRVFLPLVMKEE